MDDDTPLSFFNFVDFAAQKKPDKYDFIELDDGTIDSVAGAPNDGLYPLMGAMNPQRGRDWGLELQYRF